MSTHNSVGMRAFSHPKNSAVFIMEMRTNAIWILILEVTGNDDPYQNYRALRTLHNIKLPVALHPLAFFVCIGQYGVRRRLEF